MTALIGVIGYLLCWHPAHVLLPEAILRFADRQKRLLRRTYDESWQGGVEAYEPDADPPPTQSTVSRDMAIAGLTGVALLLALRGYPYEPPANPDAMRRAVALAPAFQGINRMALELSALSSGSAPEALASPDAALAWARGNAWRLDASTAVAWAGEQAGYAEAANQDGQLLYAWMSVGDERVCGDCELLSQAPAMPLGQWPTMPGAGDTECSYGCRCAWDTYGGDLTTDYVPKFTPDQQDLFNTLAERQAQALDSMMSDAAYLD